MRPIKRCNSKCIFCFIDQLPGNLRPSLYLKDDDFMLSFMYGNFITLNNLQHRELERIIQYKLEPLYISVHSLDAAVRKTIFGTASHARGLANLKKLDAGTISMHVQIVLCPGINDRRNLLDTLYRLVHEYRCVQSVGIVPVGMTAYNTNALLKPVDAACAGQTIDAVGMFNQEYGTGSKVFLSDEFYILAGRSFPPSLDYHGYPQIENGIGKSRDFMDAFITLAKKKILAKMKDTIMITSQYGKYVFEKLEGALQGFGVKFHAMAVKNRFLGGNVRVTGLLCAADILKAVQEKDLGSYRKILIPHCIFNTKGLTIDGYSKQKMHKMQDKLVFVKEHAKDLIGELI